MPPVFGTQIAVVAPLVILGGGQRQHVFAVDHDDEARFLALQKFLDHDFGAGSAKAASQHRARFPIGLLQGFGDDDPLAGSQAAGLDDNGCALRAQPGAVVIVFVESARGCGRYAVALQELFRKRLRTFQPGGQPARAKARHAGVLEHIDDAVYQRCFRTDDGQVHGLAAC